MPKKERCKRDERILVLSESLTERFKVLNLKVLEESAPDQTKVVERALSFKGAHKKEWSDWQKKLASIVKKNLGSFPDKVPLNARTIEKKIFATYVREKVVFDSERFMSVPTWVCSPKIKKPGEKFPAILCSHGEGPGKDPLVGLYNGEECLEYHKLIAVKLAEQGYVSITPDWRLYGERTEPVQPSGAPGETSKLIKLAERHFGFTLLGLNVWDGIKTLDYLSSRKDVIPTKIGCLGVCLGSFSAAFLALYDRRITALALSGYLGTEKEKILAGDWLVCQEEAFPGFHKQATAADVAGLLAPLPLLMQNGEYDLHLSSGNAEKAFLQVKRIYRAAGAADRLEWDFFDGGYEINVPPIMRFFKERLKGETI